MLAVLTPSYAALTPVETLELLPKSALWIDLLDPSPAEENAVEKLTGLDIPTATEIQAIEIPNRLTKKQDTLFMTAMLLAGSETDRPVFAPVTFILQQNRLITVRYHAPTSFDIFEAAAHNTGEEILLGLLETIIDRLSTPLESIASEIDRLSEDIFDTTTPRLKEKKDLNTTLKIIGSKGDLNSKVKETLVSLGRLIIFLDYNLAPAPTAKKSLTARIKTMEEDIRTLADHATFLSNKINFLLDATLGMISIEQNTIIKFFSVAAVIFMPPMLIASIYGMNFDQMPELSHALGYPAAIGVMILSAILPYLYFKHRKWF